MKGSSIKTEGWKDYELLDFGAGFKVERFGTHVIIRPEQNAPGNLNLSLKSWKQQAHFLFEDHGQQQGKWLKLNGDKPTAWQITWKNLRFELQLTKFKHVGLFPEQAANWEALQAHLMKQKHPAMLNLFAYTGAASIVSKATGAEVVHVDSVKSVIDWANRNRELNGLDGIRWIRDDAFKVLQRQVKKNARFNAVVMDPPAFGRAGNSIWKIEDQLEALIEGGISLTQNSGLLIVNTYTPKIDQHTLTEIVYAKLKHKSSVQCTRLQLVCSDGRTMDTGLVVKVYQ